MTTLLDTNVLVRHLTGDPPDPARRATSYLGSAEGLIVLDIVFAEVIHVLESFYNRPRTEVANAARSLLAMPSVRVMDIELLLRAVELYETSRLDLANAYLVAAAESWGVDSIASFDRAIDRVATVNRIEP